MAKVDEFFGELPDGYDSQLGDQGVRLSGEQCQRVALTRAMLKDAYVLVLDGATSDLDSSLEKEVQDLIENLALLNPLQSSDFLKIQFATGIVSSGWGRRSFQCQRSRISTEPRI